MTIELVPLRVKWGKVTLDIDMKVADGVIGLKTMLEEKTSVPRDRMKLMPKSKGERDLQRDWKNCDINLLI